MTREERVKALQHALLHVDSAWALCQSPLIHHRAVMRLAQRRFRDRAFPEGWALQRVLRVVAHRVEAALDARRADFLRRCLAGESISAIARAYGYGMSRSYLSRRWRREVMLAIDAEFAALTLGADAAEAAVQGGATDRGHELPRIA